MLVTQSSTRQPPGSTYINSDMAHNGRVVGQSDILGVVLVVLALRRAGRLLVDNESPLDINAHIARVQDGLLDVALDGSPPGPAKLWRRRRSVWRVRARRPSLAAGFARRGVQVQGSDCRRRRHGCARFGSWLQPRPLAAMAHNARRAAGDVLVVTVRLGEGLAGEERCWR